MAAFGTSAGRFDEDLRPKTGNSSRSGTHIGLDAYDVAMVINKHTLIA